jgi:hypothetical protein
VTLRRATTLNMSDSKPTLLFLIGAPAVGKMTVGREIAQLTGLRLFHNHASIDPVLQFFDFGSPSFTKLVEGFRRGVFEEVAQSSLQGLIFTYAWAFNLPEEETTVMGYAAPFAARGGRVLFAELEVSLDERLRRNKTELRLAEKPSKRDVVRSEQLLLEHERLYRFRSGGQFDDRPNWHRLDTTEMQARQAAENIVRHFALGAISERAL